MLEGKILKGSVATRGRRPAHQNGKKMYAAAGGGGGALHRAAPASLVAGAHRWRPMSNCGH